MEEPVWRGEDEAVAPAVVGTIIAAAIAVGVPLLIAGAEIEYLGELGLTLQPTIQSQGFATYLALAIAPFLLMLAVARLDWPRQVVWVSLGLSIADFLYVIDGVAAAARAIGMPDGASVADAIFGLGTEAAGALLTLALAYYATALLLAFDYWATRLWCRIRTVEGAVSEGTRSASERAERLSRELGGYRRLADEAMSQLRRRSSELEEARRTLAHVVAERDLLRVMVARDASDGPRAESSPKVARQASGWELDPRRRAALLAVLSANDASRVVRDEEEMASALDFALANRLGRGSLDGGRDWWRQRAREAGIEPERLARIDQATDLTNLVSVAMFDGDAIERLSEAYRKLPFESRGEMMTKAEWVFWVGCLAPVADGLSLAVVPKPPLREFVSVARGLDGVSRAQAQSMLGGKNVDFALCEGSMRIACVVELDDSSHMRDGTGSPRTVRTDEIKDMVLGKVGIPVVRVKGKRAGEGWSRADQDALRAQVGSAVTKGPHRP